MKTTTQIIPLLCLLAQIDALAIPDAQTAEVASLTDLTHKHMPWAIPMLVRAGGAVGDLKCVKKLHASTSGALESLAASNILAGLGLDTSRMSWFQHTVTVTETTSGAPAELPKETEPNVSELQNHNDHHDEHHAEISTPSTEVVTIPFLPQAHEEEQASHEQAHSEEQAHTEQAHSEQQPPHEESHDLAPFAAAAMADMVGEVFNVANDAPPETAEVAEADKAAEAPAPAPVEVVRSEEVQSLPQPHPEERQHHQGEL